jgi:uroporphyrinogen-III synthase
MPQLPLAGVGVAITRPSDQAKKLTKLIEAAGGHVIPFPLIEIAPLDDYGQFESVIADVAAYDWIIFISSNAVQNGMPRLLNQALPSHLKFAAIGPVTAKELQAFGISKVLIPEGRFDSESLLSLPPMLDMQGKKVMIVRGVGGREVLADSLKSRGANVTFAECYQRINPQQNVDALTTAWSKQQLQAIVVTSSEAMRHLLDLASNEKWLKQVTLCVNHTRIAEQPIQLGLKVKIAEAPGDEAMLNAVLKLKISN